MKTIKFYDIPEKIKFLEFDGDKEDKRLHFDRDIKFYTANENDYKEIEEHIEKYSIERKYYTVYVWCDVSGFDYWIKQMQESNYIKISVMFKADEIPIHTIKQLEEDLIKTDGEFMIYESYPPYLQE